MQDNEPGAPPRAGENRAAVEKRLADVAALGGTPETVTVDLRGERVHLNVIAMPVGDLYYNPYSHRISAQRDLNPDKDKGLREQPWDTASQGYIGYLLKSPPSNPQGTDPSFQALSDDLHKFGQTEPGIITREGVLVNGNTRRLALMERKGMAHHMRVAVLPASCTWEDVTDIELSLQLRQDKLREYSYVNQLLVIDRLMGQGKSLATIADLFRSTPKSVGQDAWVLARLRSLIDRSAQFGQPVSLTAFEEDRERLREMCRRFAKDNASNPDNAEVTRETRTAAILLGRTTLEVRLIDHQFYDKYLHPQLPDQWRRDPVPTADVAIPGLNRSVRGPSSKVAAATLLTDAVLKARAQDPHDLAVLRSIMTTAMHDASRSERSRKYRQGAADRVRALGKDSDEIITDLVLSRSRGGIDEAVYDDALIALRQSLARLAKESAKTIAEPGDGLEWLLKVTQSPADD